MSCSRMLCRRTRIVEFEFETPNVVGQGRHMLSSVANRYTRRGLSYVAKYDFLL